MSLIEVKDVQYKYEKSEHNVVLKGVNVKLESGKMYVILGPSGCGKTTLLSLLGGLDVCTEGEILFNGENILNIGLEQHRRTNVAFVFQNYNLIDYMTSEENVLLTATVDPLPILEKLGLSKEEAKRNVLKLSGGQQQRVAIARALASDAVVVLADEPTGNLDETTAKEITELLKDSAHSSNKCVVIVTHSLEVAKQADEVFELKQGVIQTLQTI